VACSPALRMPRSAPWPAAQPALPAALLLPPHRPCCRLRCWCWRHGRCAARACCPRRPQQVCLQGSNSSSSSSCRMRPSIKFTKQGQPSWSYALAETKLSSVPEKHTCSFIKVRVVQVLSAPHLVGCVENGVGEALSCCSGAAHATLGAAPLPPAPGPAVASAAQRLSSHAHCFLRHTHFLCATRCIVC